MDSAEALPHVPSPAPLWRRAALYLAAFLLAVLAYAPSLREAFAAGGRAGFLALDDREAILGNPLLRDPGGIAAIWLKPSAMAAVESHWWPLTYTTFWIEAQAHGLSAPWVRAVNLLLHGANAMLLLAVLRRLGAPLPLLAVALWAASPVRVEAVAWPIERKGLLCASFALWSVLGWLRWRAVDDGLALLGAGVAFALSLLAKSASAPLPLALLAIEWWRHRRVPVEALAGAAGMLVAALPVVGFDTWLARQQEGYASGLTPVQRALLVPASIADSLWLQLTPWRACLVHPRVGPEASPALWLRLGGLAAAVAGAAALARRGERGPAAALAAAALFLAPVSGIIDFGFMTYAYIADRYTYLAGMPVAVALAGLVSLARWRHAEAAGIAAAAVLAIAATRPRAQLFVREEALYAATLERNPQAWPAALLLGNLAMERGDAAAAKGHFRTALAANPELSAAEVNLATILAEEGSTEEAVAVFERVLSRPGSPGAQVGARLNLAIILARAGRLEEALPHFHAVVEVAPQDANARLNYGHALLLAGRRREAREQAEAARLLAPDDPRVQALEAETSSPASRP